MYAFLYLWCLWPCSPDSSVVLQLQSWVLAVPDTCEPPTIQRRHTAKRLSSRVNACEVRAQEDGKTEVVKAVCFPPADFPNIATVVKSCVKTLRPSLLWSVSVWPGGPGGESQNNKEPTTANTRDSEADTKDTELNEARREQPILTVSFLR